MTTMTSTEIAIPANEIVNKYLHLSEDFDLLTYEEAADMIEASAESMTEVNDAKELRRLADMWEAFFTMDDED